MNSFIIHFHISEDSNGCEWSSDPHGVFQHTALVVDMTATQQGAVSIRKTVLQGMVIPMLKIRRPNGRLIFNMEIAIHR